MSAGSPKFTVRRIAALSLVSLWLAGCSDTSNPPAPVSSVNGNAPANTNSGMLITPPPKMGTTSTAQQPQIQPVQQPQIQATQQPQIQPVQPVAQQPVQMENGRIVYNRQYGNIPKGSYSGSTYTVKKGDTLFYIAWITGNDFRDLAQRNNIQVLLPPMFGPVMINMRRCGDRFSGLAINGSFSTCSTTGWRPSVIRMPGLSIKVGQV